MKRMFFFAKGMMYLLIVPAADSFTRRDVATLANFSTVLAPRNRKNLSAERDYMPSSSCTSFLTYNQMSEFLQV
ncbi:hypothetical protein BDR07DRAFT_1396347, partial [Suillus spraguei]